MARRPNKSSPERRGRYRSLVVAAMAGAVLLAFTIPAAADPDTTQDEVSRVRAEITAINQSAEQAIERYNQANVELESTRQKITDNEKALGEAEVALKAAQARFNERVADIYRDGAPDVMDMLLDTSSFSEFITRYDLLSKISDQDRTDVENVLKHKSEVEAAKAELEQARSRQEEILGTLAAEKAEIESQLAARQSVLASVEADVARMATEGTGAAPGTPAAGTAAGAPPGGSPAEPAPVAVDEPAPGPVYNPPPPSTGGAVSIAMQYLGVPYVWGGASPSGFDCSGLVMHVYAQMGVYLPHSAAAQYYSGTPISYSQLAPGDLVFFGHPISHVGIYIGGGSMIHAPFEGAVVSITSVGYGGSYAGACRL